MIKDAANSLYHKELKESSVLQWQLKHIQWSSLNKNSIYKEKIELIETLIFFKLYNYEAIKILMSNFSSDYDFFTWSNTYFYEQTKHAHVLMKWREKFNEEYGLFENSKLSEEIKTSSRFQTYGKIDFLIYNIVLQTISSFIYNFFAKQEDDLLLKEILTHIAADDLRHSMMFEKYFQKEVICIDQENLTKNIDYIVNSISNSKKFKKVIFKELNMTNKEFKIIKEKLFKKFNKYK